MNEPDETPRPELPKPSFFDLCTIYAQNYNAVLCIAEKAKVSLMDIERMFIGDPVKRDVAVTVLKVLSNSVDTAWTLDNVQVPLLPEEESEAQT
jgi:hypothetical protein